MTPRAFIEWQLDLVESLEEISWYAICSDLIKKFLETYTLNNT